MHLRLILFEPDIPQNAAAAFRLAACLGISVDIIEPTGFVLSDSRLRRVGMDYIDALDMRRHDSWKSFLLARANEPDLWRRLILLTTAGDMPYTTFCFEPSDAVLVGRESIGVTDAVHRIADARLRIPLRAGMRSLNVAMAASMVMGEALRQTNEFPQD
ncbi:MAG: tRNA (cytidine(34)-2'-O)-methyltransferase [Rhodospirillales bacterium]|jgi:tRNA (cytidine/uridine-2'-O-)-methyltransferase